MNLAKELALPEAFTQRSPKSVISPKYGINQVDLIAKSIIFIYLFLGIARK